MREYLQFWAKDMTITALILLASVFQKMGENCEQDSFYLGQTEELVHHIDSSRSILSSNHFRQVLGFNYNSWNSRMITSPDLLTKVCQIR